MTKTRLDSLQVLRGIAAMLVLLSHATGQARSAAGYSYLNEIFINGWVGVDLFFVLSGFIIYHTNINHIGNPKKIREFAIKRIIRIYPIYIALTVPLAMVYFAIPSLGNGTESRISSLFLSLLLIPYPQGPILGVG